jgi:hypothetical protein
MARITETRAVSGFHSIDLRGSGTVTLVQGDTEGLTVEAEEKTMPEIETVVVNGTLRLGFKGRWLFQWRPGPISFNVTARDIEGLRISGSGNLYSRQLASKDLELQISGSGKLELDELVAGNVESSISGSGEIGVIGHADSLRCSVSGSGTLRADRLVVRDAKVQVSGSGEIFVQATDDLEVRVSGSGNVRYAGSPRLQSKVTGSGRITQIDS